MGNYWSYVAPITYYRHVASTTATRFVTYDTPLTESEVLQYVNDCHQIINRELERGNIMPVPCILPKQAQKIILQQGFHLYKECYDIDTHEITYEEIGNEGFGHAQLFNMRCANVLISYYSYPELSELVRK